MKNSRSILLLAVLSVPSFPAYAQQDAVGSAYETRLSSLEDEMRTLNGQLEQISFAIRRLDQNVQRMQSDYDARLSRLEPLVANLNSVNEARAAAATQAQSQPAGTAEGTLGALKQRDGRVTGAISSPQAPLLPETTPADVLTPQEQYDRAFGLLRQANYDEAEKAFKGFIESNPKDKMIENAKYWHAETLYVRGRFNDAAVGFADAYQQDPQGNKAPDSLLKLAMSLEGMGKPNDACTALSELKSKYPSANATIKARAGEERTKLKCGTM